MKGRHDKSRKLSGLNATKDNPCIPPFGKGLRLIEEVRRDFYNEEIIHKISPIPSLPKRGIFRTS
jgi:hypothetical protein